MGGGFRVDAAPGRPAPVMDSDAEPSRTPIIARHALKDLPMAALSL
jgi:hypothetical protein